MSPYFTLEEYQIADKYLKGVYLSCREAAKQILATNKEADKGKGRRTRTNPNNNKAIYSIINLSTTYESMPKPDADVYTSSMSGIDPYTSSSAGIRTLTKTLALQLADKGIRVNAIVPGIISTKTDQMQSFGTKQKTREKENQIPSHRIGKAKDIAKIALFLASDDASYITGSIYADGGLSLSRSNYFLESKLEQD
jgi:NAD(P)-dependent dehydrogenase (short-subunit alcohol dehydrogenase family)